MFDFVNRFFFLFFFLSDSYVSYVFFLFSMYLFFPVKIHLRRQTRWFARMIVPEFPDEPMKRQRIPDLQNTRREHKSRKIEKSDGPAYLQFVGSGANGAPRSLYFFTDYSR